MQSLPFSTETNSLLFPDCLPPQKSDIPILSEDELFWFLHYCSSEELVGNTKLLRI